MRRVLIWAIAVACAAAALAVTPAALADTAPVGADAAAPGSDPNHATPIELLASEIASHIAGRPVSVRCEDTGTWSALVTADGEDPAWVLGFVQSPPHFATGTYLGTAAAAELSPTACLALQQFAQATTKPTKCRASSNSYVTVTRYRLLRKRHRLVKVPYSVTELRRVLEPPGTCFLGTPSTNSALGVCSRGTCFAAAAAEPGAYWDEYDRYVQAIVTLAHEPIHLLQAQAGARVPADTLVESQAECYGMQWMPYVAEQLGDTPDDAQSLAEFYWDFDYPGMQSLSDPYALAHPYWSADCVPGGALDIRGPSATAWP